MNQTKSELHTRTVRLPFGGDYARSLSMLRYWRPSIAYEHQLDQCILSKVGSEAMIAGFFPAVPAQMIEIDIHVEQRPMCDRSLLMDCM